MSSESLTIVYVDVDPQGASLKFYRLLAANYVKTCAALLQAKFRPLNKYFEREIRAGRRQGVVVAVQSVRGQVEIRDSSEASFGERRLCWLPDANYETAIEALDNAGFVKFDKLTDLFN